MKYSKLSAFASSAILGMALLTGCGSDSTSSSQPTTKGYQAVDGYVAGTGKVIIRNENNTTVYTDSNVTAGKNGAIVVTGYATNTSDKVYVLGNSGFCIDVNEDSKCDNNDTNLTYDMVGPGDYTYITHLTTLAISLADTDKNASDELLSQLKGFDPVAEIKKTVSTNNEEKVKAQRLLYLGEIAKSVLKDGVKEELGKLKISKADLNSSVDVLSSKVNTIVTSLTKNKNTIIDRANTIKNTIKLLEEINEGNSTKDKNIDLTEIFIKVSDKREKVEKVLKDIATENNDSALFDDYNDTIQIIENNQTAADNSKEPKISFSRDIVVGGKTFTVIDGIFVTSLNGDFANEISNDKNLSDFYRITLPQMTLSDGFAGDKDANLSLTVKQQNTDNSLTLEIKNGKVSATDDNTSVVIKLIAGTTTINAKKTGLTSLTDLRPEGVEGIDLDDNLTLTDGVFDVTSILNNVGGNTLPKLVEKADEYIKIGGKTYDVTIDLNIDELIVDYNTLMGTIRVTGENKTDNNSSENNASGEPGSGDNSGIDDGSSDNNSSENNASGEPGSGDNSGIDDGSSDNNSSENNASGEPGSGDNSGIDDGSSDNNSSDANASGELTGGDASSLD